MLFQTQIPIFALLKNKLSEIATLKAIIKLLDVLCSLGNMNKFLSSDLTEERSSFFWNLLTRVMVLQLHRSKPFLVPTATNLTHRLMYLRHSNWGLNALIVLWVLNLFSQTPITPSENLSKMKWKEKKIMFYVWKKKWTVLVAATIMCQKLLCGILKGAYFWPLFPVKSVSD